MKGTGKRLSAKRNWIVASSYGQNQLPYEFQSGRSTVCALLARRASPSCCEIDHRRRKDEEKVCRNDVEGFHSLAQACGRLALTYDSLTVTCQHRVERHLKCSTSSKIPDRQMYRYFSSCTSGFSVTGLLGPPPDDSAPSLTSFQEVSINGVPVVNTTVHEHLEQVYARLSHANKEAPPPSYVLRLTMPPELVAFTGPVLKRSVLMPQAGPLHGLLAQSLLNSWREAMPASLLLEVEAAVTQCAPPAVPSVHAKCGTQVQRPHPAASVPRSDSTNQSAPLQLPAAQPGNKGEGHRGTACMQQAPLLCVSTGNNVPTASAAKAGPYTLKRPLAHVKPQTGRSAMLKARRMLARVSAPCMCQERTSDHGLGASCKRATNSAGASQMTVRHISLPAVTAVSQQQIVQLGVEQRFGNSMSDFRAIDGTVAPTAAPHALHQRLSAPACGHTDAAEPAALSDDFKHVSSPGPTMEPSAWPRHHSGQAATGISNEPVPDRVTGASDGFHNADLAASQAWFRFQQHQPSPSSCEGPGPQFQPGHGSHAIHRGAAGSPLQMQAATHAKQTRHPAAPSQLEQLDPFATNDMCHNSRRRARCRSTEVHQSSGGLDVTNLERACLEKPMENSMENSTIQCSLGRICPKYDPHRGMTQADTPVEIGRLQGVLDSATGCDYPDGTTTPPARTWHLDDTLHAPYSHVGDQLTSSPVSGQWPSNMSPSASLLVSSPADSLPGQARTFTSPSSLPSATQSPPPAASEEVLLQSISVLGSGTARTPGLANSHGHQQGEPWSWSASQPSTLDDCPSAGQSPADVIVPRCRALYSPSALSPSLDSCDQDYTLSSGNIDSAGNEGHTSRQCVDKDPLQLRLRASAGRAGPSHIQRQWGTPDPASWIESTDADIECQPVQPVKRLLQADQAGRREAMVAVCWQRLTAAIMWQNRSQFWQSGHTVHEMVDKGATPGASPAHMSGDQTVALIPETRQPYQAAGARSTEATTAPNSCRMSSALGQGSHLLQLHPVGGSPTTPSVVQLRKAAPPQSRTPQAVASEPISQMPSQPAYPGYGAPIALDGQSDCAPALTAQAAPDAAVCLPTLRATSLLHAEPQCQLPISGNSCATAQVVGKALEPQTEGTGPIQDTGPANKAHLTSQTTNVNKDNQVQPIMPTVEHAIAATLSTASKTGTNGERTPGPPEGSASQPALQLSYPPTAPYILQRSAVSLQSTDVACQSPAAAGSQGAGSQPIPAPTPSPPRAQQAAHQLQAVDGNFGVSAQCTARPPVAIPSQVASPPRLESTPAAAAKPPTSSAAVERFLGHGRPAPHMHRTLCVDDMTGSRHAPNRRVQQGSNHLQPVVTRTHICAARVVGQAFSKLIIIESSGVLLAIDQHAADERVRLERGQAATCACLVARAARAAHPGFARPLHCSPAAAASPQTSADRGALCPSNADGTLLNSCGGVLQSRRLKSPATVHLSAVQHLKLRQPLTLASLTVWGWTYGIIEGTGGAAEVRVYAAPCISDRELSETSLAQFLDAQPLPLAGHTGAPTPMDHTAITPAVFPTPVHTALQSIACRYAIMFGDALDTPTMVDVLAQLANTKLPFHCAHGRPTTSCLVDGLALERGLQGRRNASRSLVGRCGEIRPKGLKDRLILQLGG
eukprot:jgi/Ulvmu1/7167/UM034_0075.1